MTSANNVRRRLLLPRLPREIILLILSYVSDLQTILNLSQVSKLFRDEIPKIVLKIKGSIRKIPPVEVMTKWSHYPSLRVLKLDCQESELQDEMNIPSRPTWRKKIAYWELILLFLRKSSIRKIVITPISPKLNVNQAIRYWISAGKDLMRAYIRLSDIWVQNNCLLSGQMTTELDLTSFDLVTLGHNQFNTFLYSKFKAYGIISYDTNWILGEADC